MEDQHTNVIWLWLPSWIIKMLSAFIICPVLFLLVGTTRSAWWPCSPRLGKNFSLGSTLFFFFFTIYLMSYCNKNYIYLWHLVCHIRPYIMRDLHCLRLNTIVWQLLCFVTISFFILLINFIGVDIIICELTKLLILIKLTLFMRITKIPLNVQNHQNTIETSKMTKMLPKSPSLNK